MSTLNLTMLNRMKFLEEKISLLENENLTLKMLVEATTTATTTPSVSTMKGTKEYRSSMNVDQPIMRPPSFGRNRGKVSYRAATDRGLSDGGLEGIENPSNPAPPTGPDYNGDGVVDGADLGWILTNWQSLGSQAGSQLGALLTGWGQPTDSGPGSGGGEPPPPPTTTFSEFARQLRGTSTKDIASLSGSKYIPYT